MLLLLEIGTFPPLRLYVVRECEVFHLQTIVLLIIKGNGEGGGGASPR